MPLPKKLFRKGLLRRRIIRAKELRMEGKSSREIKEELDRLTKEELEKVASITASALGDFFLDLEKASPNKRRELWQDIKAEGLAEKKVRERIESLFRSDPKKLEQSFINQQKALERLEKAILGSLKKKNISFDLETERLTLLPVVVATIKDPKSFPSRVVEDIRKHLQTAVNLIDDTLKLQSDLMDASSRITDFFASKKVEFGPDEAERAEAMLKRMQRQAYKPIKLVKFKRLLLINLNRIQAKLGHI